MPAVKDVFSSLRPSYWLKNFVYVAPFVLQCCAPIKPAALLAGFVAWCLASSGQYIFNDILNRRSDRRHALKRHRAIAAGRLALPAAAALGVLLWTGSLLLALGLHDGLAPALALYMAAGLVYSRYLKSIFFIDAACLAFLFLLRFASGLDHFGSMLEWLDLNAFAVLYFFSLVFLKRLTELAEAPSAEAPPGDATPVIGRGYFHSHRRLLILFGTAPVALLFLLAPVSWTDSHLFSTFPVAAFKYSAVIYLLHLWGVFLLNRMRGDLYQFVLRSRITHLASLAGCYYYFLFR
jgi:decaprenyl-phosphate phosphoribosyltransferase